MKALTLLSYVIYIFLEKITKNRTDWPYSNTLKAREGDE